jgi:hypothetical protein
VDIENFVVTDREFTSNKDLIFNADDILHYLDDIYVRLGMFERRLKEGKI